MKPKASVVLSVFNGEKELPDALNSLLGQTYEFLEIIVVDDASTDNSLSILKRYEQLAKNLIVIENKTNQGHPKSLNHAIAVAQGTYIVRMDHDDLSLSHRVATQIHFLDEHPEIGCVSCYVDSLFSPEPEYGPESRETVKENMYNFEKRRRNFRSSKDINDALSYYCVFHHGEVVFRKSLWEKVGRYRTEFETAEDYDLWLRMMKHTQFYIIPEVLYIRRIYPSSTSFIYKRLQNFCVELAKKCHKLRQQEIDDTETIRTEFIKFVSSSPDLIHFLDRIKPS